MNSLHLCSNFLLRSGLFSASEMPSSRTSHVDVPPNSVAKNWLKYFSNRIFRTPAPKREFDLSDREIVCLLVIFLQIVPTRPITACKNTIMTPKAEDVDDSISFVHHVVVCPSCAHYYRHLAHEQLNELLQKYLAKVGIFYLKDPKGLYKASHNAQHH